MSAAGERDDDLARDLQLAHALESLPALEPDADFRARMRERFLRGEDAPPAVPMRRSPLRLVAPLLALAAAAVAIFFLATRDAGNGPAWLVLESSRGEVVFVDDRAYPPGHETELGRALAAGGRVRTPEGAELGLRLGDRLALRIGPASEVTLPPAELQSAGEPYRLENLTGSLAVTTGPGFPGSRLLVRAPDAEVEVVGTRFAVDVGDDGTCVCCSEGRVEVRSLQQPEQHATVAAGGMGFVMPDGALKVGPEMAGHVAPLDALAGAWD